MSQCRCFQWSATNIVLSTCEAFCAHHAPSSSLRASSEIVTDKIHVVPWEPPCHAQRKCQDEAFVRIMTTQSLSALACLTREIAKALPHPEELLYQTEVSLFLLGCLGQAGAGNWPLIDRNWSRSADATSGNRGCALLPGTGACFGAGLWRWCVC